jgi:hypothetical protein
MLHLEMRAEEVLALKDGRKWIMSFPAMLNNFEVPDLEEAQKILNGEGINFAPLENITIYRIENKHNGAGMYNCEPYPSLFQCPFYDGREKRSKAHPRPEDDSVLARQMAARKLIDPDPFLALLCGTSLNEEAQKWRYGFASADQARHWLHNDKIVNWLGDNDFIVAEFVVGPFDAMIGNTQAMYINAPEDKIKHDIKKFFNIK